MKIYSIFTSIMGEVNHKGQGSWATFIRTAGCNLRCSYCDATYAQKEESGKWMEISEILDRVGGMCSHNVLLTGGEPMLQFGAFEMLVRTLTANRYNVSVETNGTILMPPTMTKNQMVHWIIDYKLSGSGNDADHFEWENVKVLKHDDIIKFVICNIGDYIDAKNLVLLIKSENSLPRCAFSPCTPGMDVNVLWQLMLKDKLFDIALNVQLHKLIKLEEPR